MVWASASSTMGRPSGGSCTAPRQGRRRQALARIGQRQCVSLQAQSLAIAGLGYAPGLMGDRFGRRGGITTRQEMHARAGRKVEVRFWIDPPRRNTQFARGAWVGGHGQDIAATQGAARDPAESSAQVGGAAAQHRRDSDAAGNGQIGTGTAAAGTQAQFAARRQFDGAPARQGCVAAMRIDVGAGKRDARGTGENAGWGRTG
jgi:hypothetical protein